MLLSFTNCCCFFFCIITAPSVSLNKCVKSTAIIPLVPVELTKYVRGLLSIKKFYRDFNYHYKYLEFDMDRGGHVLGKKGNIAPEIKGNRSLVLKSLDIEDDGLYIIHVDIKRTEKTQASESHVYTAYLHVLGKSHFKLNISNFVIKRFVPCWRVTDINVYDVIELNGNRCKTQRNDSKKN